MKVEEDIEKWLYFLVALEMAHTSSDADRVAGFRFRFRSEIAKVCHWLDELKIVGGQLHISYAAPSHCDLCGSDLLESGLFVDGQIRGGKWANTCIDCFDQHGLGLGWGVGQLYKRKSSSADGDPLWICIAGGNPNIADSSEWPTEEGR